MSYIKITMKWSKWLKYSIHVIHKDNGRIVPSKWHNQKLIMAVPHLEYGLRCIIDFYSNLMISQSKINLREHTSSFQLL